MTFVLFFFFFFVKLLILFFFFFLTQSWRKVEDMGPMSQWEHPHLDKNLRGYPSCFPLFLRAVTVAFGGEPTERDLCLWDSSPI